MAAIDFKKDRKDLYSPGTSPAIVEVPEMLFIMVDGEGDPNESQAYADAMQILYGLSYAIRMNKAEQGYFEYVVPPPEGLWNVTDASFRGDGPIADKGQFVWTMMLRQPGFVTPAVFDAAREKLAKKKPALNLSLARLEPFAEGLCVQMMHLGPYDTEPESVRLMEHYREQRGFQADFAGKRRHHEIYLSSPQKAAPETMKTILRHPIKRR
ncbi:MAG TPA: GyrI-like domain-containing protein [Candidatus Limiplasma sp.]|nr:GyrI-like domain-containing protein [Candidatus Limiplasma sp.]HRX08155.1 GyrI-like domain-containing protein [Candidatus Limiplasma sp.]